MIPTVNVNLISVLVQINCALCVELALNLADFFLRFHVGNKSNNPLQCILAHSFWCITVFRCRSIHTPQDVFVIITKLSARCEAPGDVGGICLIIEFICFHVFFTFFTSVTVFRAYPVGITHVPRCLCDHHHAQCKM